MSENFSGGGGGTTSTPLALPVSTANGGTGKASTAVFPSSGTVSTLTNSAGANVLGKSDGTNFVASSITDNGTTVSLAEQITWASGLGAIDHGLGPSDQDFKLRAGANRDIWIYPTTAGKSSRILSPDLAAQVVVANGLISLSGAPVTFVQRIGTYNNISTIDNGVPSEIGHLDLTAQSAALSATTIYTPTATGRFRISIYEKVTTAASVSSILGGATGTVLTFTDGTDSVAQSITIGLDSQGGTVALTNSGNSTTTSLNGAAYIYALTGVPIQIAIGYTSSGTAMQYAVRATCEAL